MLINTTVLAGMLSLAEKVAATPSAHMCTHVRGTPSPIPDI